MQLLQALLVMAFLGAANCWSLATRRHTRSMLMASSDPFAELEKKLAAKASTKVAAEPTKASQVSTSASKQKIVITASAPATEKTVASPAKVVAPAPIKTSAVKQSEVVATTLQAPPAAQSSLSGGEYFAGIGLGLAPYLVLPIIFLNAGKSLIKKPKPLPEPVVQKPKVVTYSKPLIEGAKEGIAELLSDKSTPDLDLTRKAIKLSAGAFALTAGLTGLLFIASPSDESKKEASSAKVTTVKVPEKAASVPTKVKTEVKPAVKPAAIVENKVAPKVAEKPEVKISAPPVPTPAPVPKPEVAVAPTPAPAPVVPTPAVAPAAAPEVKVSAPKIEAKPQESTKKVEETKATVDETYKPNVPKGMEPEKVDLEKLKSLRRAKK